MEWAEEHEQVFKDLQTILLQAQVLTEVTKPFHIYIHERKGITTGNLTQTLGARKKPVAYISKRLEPLASGWPPCL